MNEITTIENTTAPPDPGNEIASRPGEAIPDYTHELTRPLSNATENIASPSADVVTIIRDPRNPLGKSYRVGRDGGIEKKAAVAVSLGVAVQRHVPDAESFAEVLREVSEDPHAAIINAGFPGIPHGEEFHILSEKEFEKRFRLKGRGAQRGLHRLQFQGQDTVAVGRFKENMMPSSWQLLDRDVDDQTPDQFGPGMGFGAWLKSIENLLPGVALAPRVRAGSASARVLRDGEPVGAGNGHLWVQLKDAADVARLRVALAVKAAQMGMAWRKLNKNGVKGVITTIMDLSVLIPGRLVFYGKPTVTADFVVAPQVLEVEQGTARLDTSMVKLPGADVVRDVTRKLGSELSIRQDGSYAVDAYDLTFSTEIELQDGEQVTVEDALTRVEDGGKLRCQTPFRDSVSMAGVLGRGVSDKRPFLYDVGSGTTHWLCPQDYTAGEWGDDPDRVVDAPSTGVVDDLVEQLLEAADEAHDVAGAEAPADSPDAPPADARVTASNIKAKIDAWPLVSDDQGELVREVLADLVVAELGASDEAVVLSLLKAATSVPLKALREDLAAVRRRGPAEGSAMVSDIYPVATARALVKQVYTKNGETILRRYQDEFLVWNGMHYRNLTIEDVRARAYKLFQENGIDLKGRTPVDNTIDALKAQVNVPSGTGMPAWLKGQPPVPVSELISVANGLLHIPTETLYSHTPRFFTFGSVNVEFDPAAPVPALWLKFLTEAFPGDQESIGALQEWFGYLLTPDTTQQKMLMCVGPKRCGKGTIARVLRALLGEHNVAGPTIGQLGRQFGLEGLIGKSLAVISDARVSGAADLQSVSENLLRITGEDAVSVDRKGTTDWVGKLPTRFVMMTNTLPGIIDSGGAVGSRFIVIKFTQSFFGREDVTLTDKLMTELPGILRWALDGLKALRARRAFTQPVSGLHAVEELLRRTTPLVGFIEDCVVYDDTKWTAKDDIYDMYRSWCAHEGLKFTNQRNAFFTELYAISDGRLSSSEPRKEGKQVKAVRGLRLKYPSERVEETTLLALVGGEAEPVEALA